MKYFIYGSFRKDCGCFISMDFRSSRAGGEPPRLRLHKKWKRPDQTRQANVPKRKKGELPFILFGLFDPEGLGAATRLGVSPVFKSGSTLVSPDRQMFSREKKVVFLFISWGYLTPRG
ncbi:hypothetical protein [Rossellomorea vietnamensis]|uniref:hypothetical protein n=1 Tax=Rossellomorea vietnamensis TaxID=218284 RepID=UPI003CED4F36